MEPSEGGFDLVSKNAMVAAYCREGDMEMALRLFWRESELNDSVGGTGAICEYGESNGHAFGSVSTKEAVIPDALILSSAFNACAFQAALGPGKQIHEYSIRGKNVSERDSFPYNVMIAVYAHHGHGIKAINVFQEVLDGGAGPDAVTFVALQSAG
ncbi:hypothetical protein SADUNF_Sadunf04G0107900 [Salix dunnii]|uniref:Pentatricopeptide repeat-containing protein n=1 Tax=Salix dunnii TaxID=1413687 RepID=A0A835MZ90_9ROSI|nr:hypothetical protein SADUNF_Sadunf04G0107900 [Salix dunnii]